MVVSSLDSLSIAQNTSRSIVLPSPPSLWPVSVISVCAMFRLVQRMPSALQYKSVSPLSYVSSSFLTISIWLSISGAGFTFAGILDVRLLSVYAHIKASRLASSRAIYKASLIIGISISMTFSFGVLARPVPLYTCIYLVLCRYHSTQSSDPPSCVIQRPIRV
jgi:hypothetical protein